MLSFKQFLKENENNSPLHLNGVNVHKAIKNHIKTNNINLYPSREDGPEKKTTFKASDIHPDLPDNLNFHLTTAKIPRDERVVGGGYIYGSHEEKEETPSNQHHIFVDYGVSETIPNKNKVQHSIDRFNTSQSRSVLAHELGHYGRISGLPEHIRNKEFQSTAKAAGKSPSNYRNHPGELIAFESETQQLINDAKRQKRNYIRLEPKAISFMHQAEGSGKVQKILSMIKDAGLTYNSKGYL